MEAHVQEAELDKQQALVSVIVPIYNVEKHLDRCLESILGQTYRNLEILLIDDGSTDGSLEIMNRYAERDPRVRVFHKENGGVSSARNLGLEMMSGEYCTFVDPDDYVAEVYVEWLYAALNKYEADLATCGFCSVGPDDTPTLPAEGAPNCSQIDMRDFSLFGEDGGHSFLGCWAALYKSSLMDGLRFDVDLYYGEDTLLFVSYLTRSKVLVDIRDDLYVYVQHAGSACHLEYSPRHLTIIEARKRSILELQNAPKKLYQSLVACHLMNCSFALTDMFNSPYKDSDTVRYLVKELRKYRKAVAYIPKEKKAVRLRVRASIVFPRLSSYLLQRYFHWKE
ncbi:hypothetical protein B5F79_06525 [Olsenella sp. An285]|uniref:glycosyltransferase family 2 protein n=1 Tax=Olsenella sp. An285 TaxID=1965621 RepID=UPI000B37E97E|nr:glycosyltransferase [Olsenella sp. An285]OUO46573.1 hypothetical protein B5F79_06525 [Olsenella sp. An285]